MGWCRRQKRRCVVLPGVSCIDAISCDLGIDFGITGLQVFEASTLVEGRQKLNPTAHTLLMQVGEFGTDITPDAIVEFKGMLSPLEMYLRHFFPKGHRAIICRAEHRG